MYASPTFANTSEDRWELDCQTLLSGEMTNVEIECLVQKWGDRGAYFMSARFETDCDFLAETR